MSADNARALTGFAIADRIEILIATNAALPAIDGHLVDDAWEGVAVGGQGVGNVWCLERVV
jgi:hypothetical protein